MEELLNKLYNYEYFGIYLTISIVVLILLFIIIFFFGKKDQREREKTATLKLQQINADAFKDDSIEEKVEIEKDKLENDTIIVPTIDDVPSITNITEEEIPEPILPIIEESKESILDVKEIIETPNIKINEITKEEPVIESIKDIDPVVEEITPILEKVEEKPLVFNNYTEKEETVIPEIIEEKELSLDDNPTIAVPTFNFDEIVKDVEETKKEQSYKKGPEIFSSVYVPTKEKNEEPALEEKIETYDSNPGSDDDFEFELPTLKKDIKVKENKEENQKEEETKEEKLEMPVLNDYNLDNLSGEIYTIK